MEATQTYNVCPGEDDIEDATNEDGVIDTTTENDVDGVPLSSGYRRVLFFLRKSLRRNFTRTRQVL